MENPKMTHFRVVQPVGNCRRGTVHDGRPGPKVERRATTRARSAPSAHRSCRRVFPDSHTRRPAPTATITTPTSQRRVGRLPGSGQTSRTWDVGAAEDEGQRFGSSPARSGERVGCRAVPAIGRQPHPRQPVAARAWPPAGQSWTLRHRIRWHDSQRRDHRDATRDLDPEASGGRPLPRPATMAHSSTPASTLRSEAFIDAPPPRPPLPHAGGHDRS